MHQRRYCVGLAGGGGRSAGRPDLVILGAVAGGGERAGAVPTAYLIHRPLAAVVGPGVLHVMPAPKPLLRSPTATGGLELILVSQCVPAYPEPGAAELNAEPAHTEEQVDDVPELLRGLGGLVELVGLGVDPRLELVEKLVVLLIDGLHYLGVAAAVWVILESKAVISFLELLKSGDVLEVFHGVFLSGRAACCDLR